MEQFIQFLETKNLSKASQGLYLRYVNSFLEWKPKEPCNYEKKDVLNYLSYLKNKKNYQNITRRNILMALGYYFKVLVENDQIATNPSNFIKIRGANKKTLYNVFTHEELVQILDDYYQNFIVNYNDNHIPKNQQKQANLSKQRNYVMLSFLMYQGLTTRELERIQLDNVNYLKATVKIIGSKKSNERNIALNAGQIGVLMNYIQNIRPQLLAYQNIENNSLFLPLPEASKRKTNTTTLMHTFKPLTKQVKIVDTRFENFKQVRASVITYWIQTLGLRKAQYLAGHRYISSTENYLPNDLQSLTEDMAKFNPF